MKEEREGSNIDLKSWLVSYRKKMALRIMKQRRRSNNLYKLMRLSTLKLHKSHAHMYTLWSFHIHKYTHVRNFKNMFCSMDPNARRSNHAKIEVKNILKLQLNLQMHPKFPEKRETHFIISLNFLENLHKMKEYLAWVHEKRNIGT